MKAISHLIYENIYYQNKLRLNNGKLRESRSDYEGKHDNHENDRSKSKFPGDDAKHLLLAVGNGGDVIEIFIGKDFLCLFGFTNSCMSDYGNENCVYSFIGFGELRKR